MLFGIISVIANIAYFALLNTAIYTDRSVMPDGGVREWHRSPVDRLNISGMPFLLYLQIIFSAVSVIAGILSIFGVRTAVIRKVQLLSAIASTVMFIIIMIVTANSNARYA